MSSFRVLVLAGMILLIGCGHSKSKKELAADKFVEDNHGKVRVLLVVGHRSTTAVYVEGIATHERRCIGLDMNMSIYPVPGDTWAIEPGEYGCVNLRELIKDKDSDK